MPNVEFSPAEAMQHMLSHWWIVFVLTVLGGVAGWTFHLFQPPIYEATSKLTISMIFEKKVLTQDDRDNAMQTAGAAISSTDVTNVLFQSMQTDGLSTQEINQLRDNMSKESMLTVWELHVRDRDPGIAAKYANLWASIAEQKLNEALGHALIEDQLQNQINRLESCLPSATTLPSATLPACNSYSLDEIKSELQTWSLQLASEQKLSLGILPIMTISFSQTASGPITPVLFGQASLVMGGACIGFVLSLWVANARKVQSHD